MYKSKFIIVAFIFINLFSQERTIYIAKNYWHTGVVIPIDKEAVKLLPSLKFFKENNFVDIGMGEKDFYMSPSREILPAAKAILIPTDATIRMAEVPGDTSFLRRISDFLIELKLDNNSFRKLLMFVDSSITKNELGEEIIIEKRAEGSIVFYESPESYHLFNTCNTWLASALKYSGMDIDPNNVITSKELFRELLGKGRVIKFDKTDSFF